MTEAYWLILIIWFALLAFAYNNGEKLFKVAAALFGIFTGIAFANEATVMLQYAGLIIIAVNLYVGASAILKK